MGRNKKTGSINRTKVLKYGIQDLDMGIVIDILLIAACTELTLKVTPYIFQYTLDMTRGILRINCGMYNATTFIL